MNLRAPDPARSELWPRWPHHWSVQCIHGKHDDCRSRCEVCDLNCRCDCHGASLDLGTGGAGDREAPDAPGGRITPPVPNHHGALDRAMESLRAAVASRAVGALDVRAGTAVHAWESWRQDWDVDPRNGVRYTSPTCGCPMCTQLIEDWDADHQRSLADADPEDAA